jgi:hypothetical protein
MSRFLWELICIVVVEAGLDLIGGGAEGENGEKMMDDVVMETFIVEVHVILLVILLQ